MFIDTKAACRTAAPLGLVTALLPTPVDEKGLDRCGRDPALHSLSAGLGPDRQFVLLERLVDSQVVGGARPLVTTLHAPGTWIGRGKRQIIGDSSGFERSSACDPGFRQAVHAVEVDGREWAVEPSGEPPVGVAE